MAKYIFLFLALLPCSSFAESSVWRASKGGQSFYLGGTCHLLRPSDYPLPAEFELAYSLTDTLVFEMDPALAQDPEFAFRLLRASSYTDRRSLKNILPPKTYKVLAVQCERSGFSIEVLNKTKPGMVVMMLMVKELANFGVTEGGVDIYYHDRGLKDNKKVLALETGEFQIELISSLGDGIEDTIISYGLKDIYNLKNNFGILVDAWKEGNLVEIDKYFVNSIRAYPKLYSKLLVDRNKQWINSLDTFINTPEIEFVLVGVAHMAGDKGLLSLLQKKGYTIEQISVPL